MKYIIRAAKYFCYLVIFLAIIITIFVLTGFVEADLSKMFVHGYDSLWQMGAVLLVFSLIYPRFGFSRRTAHVFGSREELQPVVVPVMERLGYVLEGEKDGGWSFRRRSAVSRVLKMLEDRIVLTPAGAGVEVEGLTRDLPRIISALEATREDA
ncbi:hypothetical protein SAMN06298214_1526 [Bacteroidales bacterium WCE2004]|nr:hypothetical protein SAMN06298214_1526 [Bacteroidales bacterium WCE2004]